MSFMYIMEVKLEETYRDNFLKWWKKQLSNENPHVMLTANNLTTNQDLKILYFLIQLTLIGNLTLAMGKVQKLLCYSCAENQSPDTKNRLFQAR